jgi:CheY-like chemotaxis protein
MASKPLSVLLVDDDEITANIFRMVIDHNQNELTLHSVVSGDEALEYLSQTSPDVVVIDIFLPGLDGYQLFNAIKERHLAPDSTFIATTAYYTSDTKTEVMLRGFDGYVTKPLDVNKLVPYIQSTLQSKQQAL